MIKNRETQSTSVEYDFRYHQNMVAHEVGGDTVVDYVLNSTHQAAPDVSVRQIVRRILDHERVLANSIDNLTDCKSVMLVQAGSANESSVKTYTAFFVQANDLHQFTAVDNPHKGDNYRVALSGHDSVGIHSGVVHNLAVTLPRGTETILAARGQAERPDELNSSSGDGVDRSLLPMLDSLWQEIKNNPNQPVDRKRASGVIGRFGTWLTNRSQRHNY